MDYVHENKPYSEYFTDKYGANKNLVIYHHGIGESSCSNRIRELIVLTYLKSPNSLVISLDSSHWVSTLKNSVETIF